MYGGSNHCVMRIYKTLKPSERVQTDTNDDLHSGQGANTFGRSIDLDRLPIRFHRRPPKSRSLQKSRTLAMGFGFLY